MLVLMTKFHRLISIMKHIVKSHLCLSRKGCICNMLETEKRLKCEGEMILRKKIKFS